MSRDGGGPPRHPVLDGDPRVRVAPAPGPRRALGRDPFDAPEGPDPFLARLGVQAPPAPAETPGAPETTAPEAPEAAGARPRPPAPRPDAGTRLRGLASPDAPADPDARLRAALEAWIEEAPGYDPFGLSPDAVRRTLPLARALYRYWFRVRSEGHEHLPAEGPAVLVANHGGLLPFDGAMGVLDVLLKTDPPRLPRALVDRFAGELPFVNVLFARLGQVTATRRNFRALLDRGELVWVFPEGIEGIRKPLSQRYRLQSFAPGFAEEALRADVPIVPVAMIGPDDQAPVLANLDGVARRLGLPAVPITPTFPWLGPLGLLPYPVPYRIVYGAPIAPRDLLPADAADDPRRVRYLASEVRRVVQRMVDRSRS